MYLFSWSTTAPDYETKIISPSTGWVQTTAFGPTLLAETTTKISQIGTFILVFVGTEIAQPEPLAIFAEFFPLISQYIPRRCKSSIRVPLHVSLDPVMNSCSTMIFNDCRPCPCTSPSFTRQQGLFTAQRKEPHRFLHTRNLSIT